MHGGYDLGALDDGGVPPAVDTRSVYRSALEWLRAGWCLMASSRKILRCWNSSPPDAGQRSGPRSKDCIGLAHVKVGVRPGQVCLSRIGAKSSSSACQSSGSPKGADEFAGADLDIGIDHVVECLMRCCDDPSGAAPGRRTDTRSSASDGKSSP